MLFACPFVIFGLAEAVGLVRRRRQTAVAQRTKGPRRGADEPAVRPRRLTRG
ncbi:MAG: hypothetical protein QOD42_3700 [Sphingomonadales bacterium]|jgi:hypothetical protein|nr:hypothetical protein [Sphingomonadales bacterium]